MTAKKLLNNYYQIFAPHLKDFMEQQLLGFSDSTPKVGSNRIKKIGKKLDECSALQLISNSQIIPQKYRSGHFNPFKFNTNINQRRTPKESF